MAITLEDLQKAIEEADRELSDLKAAYRVMERLGGLAEKTNTRADPITPTIAESGLINLDEIEFAENPRTRGSTLLTDVRCVIGRLGDQEFTSNHVGAVLTKMGKGSEAKHFKNRISVAIRTLTDEGLIARTHKGAGNDPHRYRVAEEVGVDKIGSESLRKKETEPGGPGSVHSNHLASMAAVEATRKVGGT